MRKFTSVKDVPDVLSLSDEALALKNAPFSQEGLGKHKTLGLIFMNPSLRTRISSQKAATSLGMEVMVLNVDKEGWALEFREGAIMNGTTVEHVKDAAAAMGRYCDIIGIRCFPGLQNREEDYAEIILNQFIRYAGVPVISLESATLHPLQSLADLITIRETWKESGRKPKVVLTWAPHIKPIPQCVSNSFAQWLNKWSEADFVITHPEGYELDEQFTKGATITTSQTEALKNADFVYVKNWSSVKDYGKVLTQDSNWMITNKHLQSTNNAKVMHCLPVRRNVELSDEILDGNNSLVTAQAKNRIWAAQAVIADILRNN